MSLFKCNLDLCSGKTLYFHLHWNEASSLTVNCEFLQRSILDRESNPGMKLWSLNLWADFCWFLLGVDLFAVVCVERHALCALLRFMFTQEIHVCFILTLLY